MSQNPYQDNPEVFPHGEEPQEKLGTGLFIVCLLIPLVGIILYFVNKNTQPLKAKAACNAALIGFAISVVLNVLVRMA